jgi:hypothetical protein
MPRFLRYLRIAFSATCLIACLLLIVLWVRSYSLEDVISSGGPRFPRCLQVVSGNGRIETVVYEESPTKSYWEWTSMPFAGLTSYDERYGVPTPVITPPFSFCFDATLDEFSASVPHWFCALMVACLSFTPWIHWSKRFSLRTLLIATSLVAVVLGLIVWMSSAS